MSLLPIPVGCSKPPTCERWSIVNYLLHDTPMPYTVDPDVTYHTFDRASGNIRISFPHLAHLLIESTGQVVPVPAVALEGPRADSAILYHADYGKIGHTTQVAMRLLQAAGVDLLAKWLPLTGKVTRDAIEQFLYGGDPVLMLRNLQHFTLQSDTQTD